MAGFSDKFTDSLAVVAEKVDDNKYLGSLKNAFTYFLPIILVGSFATLLNTLISSKTTGLAIWIPWLANLAPAFSAMSFATLTFMTVPLVFLLAIQLAKRNGTPEFATALLAVAAYISVVPQSVTATVTGTDTSATAAGLGSSALGAQGLFIGIIWTILVTELFRGLSKVDALKIKMPPGVPPALSQSFSSLVPILIAVVASAIAGVLFKLATGAHLNEWIYAALQRPLEGVFQSPAGVVLMVMAAQLFWFLGIHGGLVISPIRNPLMAVSIAANVAAVQAGQEPTQILTYGWWMTFAVIGGAGATLCLCIAALLISKQRELRVVSKLGLVPGICGISEPMVFGVPLVLNPLYAIPFIGNAGLCAGIAVFFNQIGFIQPNTVDVPFGLPIFLNALIGFGWQGIVVQIVLLVVCTLTWIPFVIADDRRAAREAARATADGPTLAGAAEVSIAVPGAEPVR